MIVIKLSGGDVIGVENDSGAQIEIRQYHRDYLDDGPRVEDEAGRYQTIWPEPVRPDWIYDPAS